MISGNYLNVGILAAIMVILIINQNGPVFLFPLGTEASPLVTSNETSKNRLIVRNPEYHGSVFANQISLSTNKQSYEQGQIINFTITNLGTRPVHFSVENSKIEIKNLQTNQTFIPSTLLLSFLIPSGGFNVITWNQKDFDESQVRPGKYLGVVTIGTLNSNVTFSIN